MRSQGGRFLTTIAACLLLAPCIGHAQYFGKNTVRWERFEYRTLRTEHFDIYYYDDNAAHIERIAELAERWNERLSGVLEHRLTRRQPIVVYASHPHFRQTNTSPADIGEGTGGFTEIFRNRVVMPFAGTLGETDHVLGHELVHAFQFDMTGRATDPERFGNIPGAIRLPLWLVEGMSEYLSVGPYDSHTAMWLRDLVVREEDLKPRLLRQWRFQPYRHGHGLMAYLGGRFGDRAIGRFLVEAAAANGALDEVFESVFDMSAEALLEEWQESLHTHYEPMLEGTVPASDLGRELLPAQDRRGLPSLNLAPALSPDGRRALYIAQPQRLRLEMYLMDVETGEVIRRLTRTALDPHFEALQFVRSAGAWSPDSDRVVFAAIRRGRPVLEIVRAADGRSLARHEFRELGEIFNPAWSPDGRRVAFAGTRAGLTDLYVFDLDSQALQRLTDDVHAVRLPDWSPDGRRIAFVTDRFAARPDVAAPREYGLAVIDVDDGTIQSLPRVPGTRQFDPNWSADGRFIYFLADVRGTSNIYRLDLDGGEIRELTNVPTGISGLTALSPALSVAGPRDTMAFTVFEGGGFALMLVEEGGSLEGWPLDPVRDARELALLPPAERTQQQVAHYLAEPGVPSEVVDRVQPYRPRLGPEYVSQAVIGAGTGTFGTAIAGGISVHWSDLLGNHNLVTQIQSEYYGGDFSDSVAALVGYQNRVRRFDWGGVAAQIPSISASYAEAVTTIDGEPVLVQQAARFWEINRLAIAGVGYPLSRAARVEFDAGYRRISLDARETTRITSLVTGERLVDRTEDIPTPGALSLITGSAAFVYDTSIFGSTSPALGQRARVEAGGVGGDLKFFTPLVDYRAYWMPLENVPLTLAGRALHFGRYGADAEHPRLRPLYLGSPTLVRGYDRGFSIFSDPVIERLQGSRIAVANVEARMPIMGVRGFIGGPLVPPVDAALFFDAGTAWSKGERPDFVGGDQKGVTSYGISLRTNLGGIVLEFNYVNAQQYKRGDWRWQFVITPGF